MRRRNHRGMCAKADLQDELHLRKRQATLPADSATTNPKSDPGVANPLTG